MEEGLTPDVRATIEWYSDGEIIDAGHELDWDDHDIAALLATLEEMTGRG